MTSHASRHRSLIGLALLSVAVMGLTGSAFAADSAIAAMHSGAAAASAPASAPAKRKTSVLPSSQQLDINSASRQKLKTLPGIGDAEAAKIIAGRPYYSKTDLVTRNVLPEGAYASIKYRIFAAPPAGKSGSKK